MQTMKHDLKEPCSAVRTDLETMKCLPCFQIGILDQVLSLMPVPQEQRRRAIAISPMRHRRALEVFNLNLRTKKQLTLPKNFCVQGRRRRMAGPGAAATTY